MLVDVVLHQFGREAVNGTARGSNQHQHVRAADLGLQSPVHCLRLGAYPIFVER